MLIKDIDSDRWIQFWSFVLKHKHHLHPALNAKGKGNLEAPTFLLLALLLHFFHLVKIGDNEQKNRPFQYIRWKLRSCKTIMGWGDKHSLSRNWSKTLSASSEWNALQFLIHWSLQLHLKQHCSSIWECICEEVQTILSVKCKSILQCSEKVFCKSILQQQDALRRHLARWVGGWTLVVCGTIR